MSPEPRCYTVRDLLERLKIPEATFYYWKAAGRLPPFLEELPRFGRRLRYRADLVDEFLSGAGRRPTGRQFFRKSRSF